MQTSSTKPYLFSDLPDDIIINIFTFVPLHENQLHFTSKWLNQLLTPSNVGNANLMKLIIRQYAIDEERGFGNLVLKAKRLFREAQDKNAFENRSGLESFMSLFGPKSVFLRPDFFKYKFVYDMIEIKNYKIFLVDQRQYELAFETPNNILIGIIDSLQLLIQNCQGLYSHSSRVPGQIRPYSRFFDPYYKFKNCEYNLGPMLAVVEDIIPDIDSLEQIQKVKFLMETTSVGFRSLREAFVKAKESNLHDLGIFDYSIRTLRIDVFEKLALIKANRINYLRSDISRLLRQEIREF